MSRVASRNTDIELALRSALHRLGLRFRIHVRDLPGTPDIVFTRVKVAIFVDGDFWHGYRFDASSSSLPEYWKLKITRNRQRDRANRRLLRQAGWYVVRVWGHEVKRDISGVAEKVAAIIASRAIMTR